jgi:hypothetical protein
MDVMMNEPLWGYKMSHLYHYDGIRDAYGEPDQALTRKGHRTTMASMLVRGVEFLTGLDYKQGLAGPFRLFKALPGELIFLPGWEAQGLFKEAGGDKDIELAVWRKPDAFLLVVTNYSKHAKRARVWVDVDKLLPPQTMAQDRVTWDLETLDTAGWVWQDGHLMAEVAPRDFRIYLIGNFRPVMATGF